MLSKGQSNMLCHGLRRPGLVRAALVSGSLLIVAACGGGGGGATPAAGLAQVGGPPAASPTATAQALVAVPVSIGVPSGLSSGAKSSVLSVQGGSSATVSCSPSSCQTVLNAPPGTDLFEASLFGGPNGSGSLLAAGSATLVVRPGNTAPVSLVFGGVPSKITLTAVQTDFVAGLASTLPIGVTVFDASGSAIVGSGPFSVPVSLSSSDRSGSFSINPQTVTSPQQQTGSVSYNGSSATNGTTIAATAAGVSASNIVTVTFSVRAATAPPLSPSPSTPPSGGPTPTPQPTAAVPTPTPRPTAPGATPTPKPTAPPVTPTPKPTAPPVTPTPVPTATPAGGNVATYAGCNVFTAGDWYNAPVAGANPDPNTAKYIQSVADAPNGTLGLYAYAGFKTNVADGSTPILPLNVDSRHTIPGVSTIPWASNFFIQQVSDAHAEVLDRAHCVLYETSTTANHGSSVSAYTGWVWDLKKPYAILPTSRDSSIASGLPLFPGAAHYSEYAASGKINHALDIVMIAHTVCDLCFVAPAVYTDWLCYKGPAGQDAAYQLPYGARLRLRSTFNDSSFGPQARAVTAALKTYGAFVSDTASSATKTFMDNDTGTWNSGDLASLGSITIRDFDVMPLGTINRVNASCVN